MFAAFQDLKLKFIVQTHNTCYSVTNKDLTTFCFSPEPWYDFDSFLERELFRLMVSSLLFQFGWRCFLTDVEEIHPADFILWPVKHSADLLETDSLFWIRIMVSM